MYTFRETDKHKARL